MAKDYMQKVREENLLSDVELDILEKEILLTEHRVKNLKDTINNLRSQLESAQMHWQHCSYRIKKHHEEIKLGGPKKDHEK